MKSWTIFKSHIIPLAKMRLFLRPVMRSLIVPQYALECLKMPSGTIRKIVPDGCNSLIFRVLTTQYSSSFHIWCNFCKLIIISSLHLCSKTWIVTGEV